MANTINPIVLRARYRERYGHDLALRDKVIQECWRMTAGSTGARGRHMPRTALEQRAELCLTLLAERISAQANDRPAH